MNATPCAHAAGGNPGPAEVARLAGEALAVVEALTRGNLARADAIIAAAPCTGCLVVSLGSLVISAIGNPPRPARQWVTAMQTAAASLAAAAAITPEAAR